MRDHIPDVDASPAGPPEEQGRLAACTALWPGGANRGHPAYLLLKQQLNVKGPDVDLIPSAFKKYIVIVCVCVWGGHKKTL